MHTLHRLCGLDERILPAGHCEMLLQQAQRPSPHGQPTRVGTRFRDGNLGHRDAHWCSIKEQGVRNSGDACCERVLPLSAEK